jgi:hypothetical protein
MRQGSPHRTALFFDWFCVRQLFNLRSKGLIVYGLDPEKIAFPIPGLILKLAPYRLLAAPTPIFVACSLQVDAMRLHGTVEKTPNLSTDSRTDTAVVTGLVLQQVLCEEWDQVLQLREDRFDAVGDFIANTLGDHGIHRQVSVKVFGRAKQVALNCIVVVRRRPDQFAEVGESRNEPLWQG